MNIVIEGCDCTGKSTLAHYLAERLGLYYWHESQPRNLSEYKQMLTNGGIVFDRFCFGQFVYNTPEQRQLTLEELKDLLEYFKETKTILIFVDAHTDTIIKRMLDRGEGNAQIIDEMTHWVKNIRGSYRSILKESQADYIEISGEDGLCLT